MNRFLLFTSAMFVSLVSLAQDHQYSQFYAAPLYINPAFTGLTPQHRFVANMRDQWPGLPNDFVSTSMSYDRNIESINSGVGFIADGELAGSGNLWHTEIAPTYAYQAVINDKYIIRPGIKVGFDFMGINKNKLVFNDELDNDLQTGTAETNIKSSVFYIDFSAGLLAMTERYWFGFSMNHMNRPDQSLIDDGRTNRLPTKLSIHGGAKFPLPSLGGARAIPRDFTLVAHYKAQAKYDQLDIGGYYTHNHLVMGIWYRGLPIKSNKQQAINADALTLMLGIKHEEKYSLGFSYDLTVSRLSFTRSAGSFELSYIREWEHKRKKRRKQFIVPCAKF